MFQASRSQRGSAQAAPPLSAEQLALARRDAAFATLAFCMWLGTAIKVWPMLPGPKNAQSALGLVAMFVISIAWPMSHVRSFSRWRVPALACLRLILIIQPFNFDTQVVDAIAPLDTSGGRLAWVNNLCQTFLGMRVALLLFSALGWPLPLRVHIPLQATKIALLINFAVHPYCQSKLMSSSEIEGVVSAAHGLLAVLAMPFVPPAAIIVPEDSYSRRVSLLLFSWLVFDWLLPTLLLLPNEAAQRAQRQQDGAPSSGLRAIGSRLLSRLEAGLRLLLLPARLQQRQQEQRQMALSGGQACLLRWWAVLLLTWGACCSLAPLYVPPR